MKPRIYTYKITFPHQGWWYWGVHKEKKAGETYDGSPKVHKDKWNCFEYEKQILEYFDTYEEARSVEERLIKPDLNNPMCLNEGCGGEKSLALAQAGGRVGGKAPAGAKLKAWLSDYTKNRVPPNRGRHWFNDGERETLEHTCPAGFKRGRLSR